MIAWAQGRCRGIIWACHHGDDRSQRTGRMKGDLLGIIEAAYAVSGSQSDWVAGLLRAAYPLIDGGLGAFCHTYEIDDAGHVVLGAVYTSDGPVDDEFRRKASATIAMMSPEGLAGAYPRVPVAGYISQLANRFVDNGALAYIHPTARDAFGVVGGNPSGRGVVLHGGHARPGPVSRRDRAVWTYVASHLAAGLRLSEGPGETDAVMTPSGRLEHAEGDAKGAEARATLAEEARAIERARGRLRRTDPVEAVTLWRSLIGGQWSIVDHIDSDGRRYLLARRNAPRTPSWGEASERERQVLAYAGAGHTNKMIGYELGLSPSTVSSHLASAARRLGFKSRLDLVRAFSSPDALRDEAPRASQR
jgi:DNA-binding CsgD family transcriptional regulator